MICKNCGEVISDHSTKCPRCGTSNPDMYAVKNPYTTDQPTPPIPFTNVPPYSPAQGQTPPPVPTPYPTSGSVPPKFYGVPVSDQSKPYTPLPYSNSTVNTSYYPVPQVKPDHSTRNIVLAITIPIVSILIIFSIVIVSFSQLFSSGFDNYVGLKGTKYNPYVAGEPVKATGEHLDSQFADCICTSEITLQEFISGDLANNYMKGLGANLSLLEADEQYVVARFRVKLLTNSTENDVYYGDYDFYFLDNLTQQYLETPSYDNISPDSIRLSVGETGEVVIFAVAPKNADLQAVYFTEDSYLCFGPQHV